MATINTLSEDKVSKHIKSEVKNEYSRIETGKFGHNIYTFKDDLETNLYKFDIDQDRMEYCQFLFILLHEGLNEHKRTCPKPKPCRGEEQYEKAIFIVDRKLKSFISDRRYTYEFNPADPYSVDEEINILAKLQEISDHIKRLEIGQQVIYDDIEEHMSELQKLPPILGKRKFTELFMGTLMSLGLKYSIEKETINKLYEIFTSSGRALID